MIYLYVRTISKHAPTPNNSNRSFKENDNLNDQMSYTSRYIEENMKNYSENSQQFHQSFTDSNLSKYNPKKLNLSQSMNDGSGISFY